jgi:Flp pilus assembly protein TadG
LHAGSHSAEHGQAIVLVALVLTVLFGFLGLAIDGGRGYLDRRHLQGSVDAAALAAAYDYMNNSDYGQAELAAVNQFASNERLYLTPSCTGYGSLAVTCTFNDPTTEVLTLNVADHSIAGVTFRATGVHHVGITVMQVLGFGSTMTIGATATAVARHQGSNGAAIQTLSPGNCNGTLPSLVFTGTSTTSVTGDVWSNGIINDNGSAGGSIEGNVVNVCPDVPPTRLPNFNVTGSEASGFNIPDPGFAQPALNTTTRTWNSASGSTQLPGTYAADPHLAGGAGCYFLSGGIYDFSAGFTQNGGFVSNELRPPDEPNLVSDGVPNRTTLSTEFSGTRQTSVPVNALSGAVPENTVLSIAGQTFTVASNTAAGATSITITRQDVSGTIPSGTLVSISAYPQFWDSNGVGCGSSFTLSTPGSGNLSAGTYSVEVTSVGWQPNGIAACSGPAGPTCYERESAPSVCKTVKVGTSGNLKVDVGAVPGAQDFNVYVADNDSCSGLAYCTHTGGNSSVTITNCPSGQPPPPDQQSLPVGAGLPNSDPPSGTPPAGDLANSTHCVDPTSGVNATCPTAWTVGAVMLFIPGGGNTSTCLNLQGGGDFWVYSGYQYARILVFEPGPQQPAPANTCPNNVAGHGVTSLIGIIYAPAADVTIIGSSSYLATIAGGVISWTATIKGNGGVSIMADPTLRTFPSAVRLIQ